MKFIKLSMRFWITLTSLMSFLIGWAMLAHSPKPIQPVIVPLVNSVQLPALQPLDFSNNGNNNGSGARNFQVNIQPSSNFAPMFRTGGS
jgi:hypothetical protein